MITISGSCFKIFPLGVSLLFFSLLHADEWALSPGEAHEKIQDRGQHILFLDVRDPVEIQFIGFTDLVDLNIPFRLVDRNDWSDERKVFAMPLNPGFIDQVQQALEAKSLDKTAVIITMCRSGSARGRPSAEYLRNNGFPNAYYVRNGFQGDSIREGKQKGMRLQNGWQNEGLPWSSEINPDKIHKPGVSDVSKK